MADNTNILGNNGIIRPRTQFFDTLQRWETCIPEQSLWLVTFDIPQRVVNDMEFEKWSEKFINKHEFTIDFVKPYIVNPSTMNYIGCIFATSVGLPPERNDVESRGVDNRGFIRVPVLTKRTQFEPLRIDFRETNISFIDLVIRPWTILSSHYGFVARPDINIRTDITVMNLGKAGTDIQVQDGQDINLKYLVPRKIWIFLGCVPTNVNASDYTYGQSSDPETRQTQWVYDRYNVFSPRESVGELMGVGRGDSKPNLSLPLQKQLISDQPTFKKEAITNPPFWATDKIKVEYDKIQKVPQKKLFGLF